MQDHARRDEQSAGLLRMIQGFRVTQVIHVAAALGLADYLSSEPRTVAELAAHAGVPGPSLERLLRALVNLGLLDRRDARFALTTLGRPLARDAPDSLHALAVGAGRPEMWRPWGELLSTIATGAPAFERVFGVDQDTHFSTDPVAGAAFDAIMTTITERSASACAEAYDFSQFRRIVDVGGSRGALLAKILTRYPTTRGVLCDLPRVIEGARPYLERAGVAERCTLEPGDFFAGVPAGGDAYILKWVLHGWDNPEAISILCSCRAAMADSARLLIVESVVPEGPDPHHTGLRDLQMMLMGRGRERTEREYRGLLNEAGFELLRVIPSTSEFHVLEAAPVATSGAAR